MLLKPNHCSPTENQMNIPSSIENSCGKDVYRWEMKNGKLFYRLLLNIIYGGNVNFAELINEYFAIFRGASIFCVSLTN